MTDKPAYESLFPFQNIRDEQRQAIEFALDAFQRGIKYVILEMGTGCGKSATGVTIARALHAASGGSTSGAYILTTQKLLQEQYVRDFGLGTGKGLLSSIKSSSNYQCGVRTGQTCAETRRIISNARLAPAAAKEPEYGKCRTACPYMIDKKSFIGSSIGITNFAYFLAETRYAGQLTPRDLLVIDECHNVESELGRFVEVTFSERFARDILGCRAPSGNIGQSDIHAWIAGPYKRALTAYGFQIESEVESRLRDGNADLGDLSRRLEVLDKHVCKVNRLIADYDPKGWIMNIDHGPGGMRKFEFKPVDVSGHSEDALFRYGSKVLLMSATVVDKNVFCRTIGIPLEQAAFLRIPSPFPVENRLVHFMPVGGMSRAKIDATLPRLVEAVKLLLAEHATEKGIVHCVNYRIARYLVENIKDPRLLLHDATNREATIHTHAASPDPTVLVSPSMMEGVDLVGDLSRFQIIVKVPFPFLGDEVVKRRMDADPRWYAYQTARSVMQALGRSVRSEIDHAVSYILDEDWGRFYRNNSDMFPIEFRDAVS